MQFDLPKEKSSIIKVIGVGGGGGNAVNHMFKQGIRDVNFVICNTDAQAMDLSPIPNKIQLGTSITEGLGAGCQPEVGRTAALESIEDIKAILENNTKMVFITAGMGGGTGTGAAPVIAQIAKEMGILTVGIVTTPFSFEGKKRRFLANEGIEELRQNVDSLLVISNDKLREIYGNFSLPTAFAQADNVLTTAAKGIAEIITYPGQINVDFADVRTVLSNSGVAIMGAAATEGDNRAIRAIEAALTSPLLNDNDIRGAKHLLVNISSGTGEAPISMDEVDEITNFVQEAAGHDADMFLGLCYDDSLENKISVTVIATGFETRQQKEITGGQTQKIVRSLDEPVNKSALKASSSSSVAGQKQTPNQYTIEFDISQQNKPKPAGAKPEKEEQAGAEMDQLKKMQERQTELRKLSYKIYQTGRDVNDLENEPAYKRRNIPLNNVPHSSESNVSRFTLESGDEDERPELRKGNSFLHDNVD